MLVNLSFRGFWIYIYYNGEEPVTVNLFPDRLINLEPSRTMLDGFRRTSLRDTESVTRRTLRIIMKEVHETCYGPENSITIFLHEIEKCCEDIFGTNMEDSIRRISELDIADLYYITEQSTLRCSDRYFPHTMVMGIAGYIRGDFGMVRNPDNNTKQGVFANTNRAVYPARYALADHRAQRGLVERAATQPTINQRVNETQAAAHRLHISRKLSTPPRAKYPLRSRTKWIRKDGRLTKTPVKRYPK